MNAYAEMLVDGLVELEEMVGASFSWPLAAGDQAEVYACSGGSELRGKRLDIGGFQFHADCVIVVRAALFGNGPRPESKQRLVYRSTPEAAGRVWRVDAVRTVYDAILVLECNDPTQGA
jgi:hypothetical protein